MRVLCLDIEGGYGGSSRSLFEFLKNVPRQKIDIEVWHKKNGPIGTAYSEQNIYAQVTPSMPKATSVEKFSRNCVEYGRFIIQWPLSYAFRKNLLKHLDSIDLIHFNHEGLFLLAKWLRKRTLKPMTMHIRTIPPENMFSRWQARTIARCIDDVIAIAEPEAEIFKRRSQHRLNPQVIYNPIVIPSNIKSHPAIPEDNRLKLASLSNFALIRGVDRLADVAQILKEKNVKDILFVLAGNMSLPKNFPEKTKNIKSHIDNFEAYTFESGIRDFFIFLGHTNHPEKVLAGCDALIKLGRGQGGRDILESLGAEKPVLTIGESNRFLENGKTAILFSEFNARAVADAIIDLAKDRLKLSDMGGNGKSRIVAFCDPKERALDLLNFWEVTLAKKSKSSRRSS